MITSGSTGGPSPWLNKIRFRDPAQGFPPKTFANLVRARRENKEASDTRHVDILFGRGAFVYLSELERLVSVDVKILNSWTVPDERLCRQKSDFLGLVG